MRRVVPSPAPKRIFGIEPIQWLLEHGTIVICAGGGGIPVDVHRHRGPGGPRARRRRGRHRQGPRQRAARPRPGRRRAADRDRRRRRLPGWGTPTSARSVGAAPGRSWTPARSPAGRWAPRSEAACSVRPSAPARPAVIGSIDDTVGDAAGDGRDDDHGPADAATRDRMSGPHDRGWRGTARSRHSGRSQHRRPLPAPRRRGGRGCGLRRAAPAWRAGEAAARLQRVRRQRDRRPRSRRRSGGRRCRSCATR